jgi:TolB-like protein/tRNA A-37 threonylcarbamoyl transferase component Bud32/tetratricopeptide (TPR) repeat protein
VTNPVELLNSALEERYSIERELGQGGMATVYLAQDLKHERKVAIKVLRPELSISLGADRFLREIRVAANLQHPNILGLYDSGEAHGLLYYVMPFIEGESLRDRLNREQQLPIQDALQITRESAEALAYAHEHGIVHRDIKPENILLQQGHALVADFGIARAVSQAGGEKLTQTGMAVGTPHYMSPEQSLGSEHVDARSDVYSLGCVLYELLVGQPPFLGPNAMAIMARHSMEVVPSLQVVRQSVPDEVEDAVLQALEKTPADRFQTMRQFAEVLAETEADAALQRTAARRAAIARRTSGTKGVPAVRRTGSRAVSVSLRKTPVELAAAAIRQGGVKFWSITIAAVVALGALGWGGWRLLHHRGGAQAEVSSIDPNRIAVLYFEKSEGGADSLSYLADGLTEALIHELSGVEGLQVTSSNGVRPYRKGDVPLKQIAQELHVGTLVHGGVSQSGNRLRVNVALIDAGTGVEIGSRTLERPREELFALQDDLAKEVSVFLRQQLGKEVQVRETRAMTRDVVAWERYQKAQQEAHDADALAAAEDTAGAARKFARTDSLLAEAEARDAKWPAPPALRGWLNFRRSRMAPSAPPSYHDSLIEQGLVHAERALGLKPDDPDALELRGTLRYWKWLNNLGGSSAEAARLYDDAEKDLRASVEANPAQASAWTTLSHLLLNKPATAEAKLAATRAYTADPYLTNANVTVYRLFATSYQLDDPVEAKRWCDEGQRRFPQDYRFADCQLTYYSMKGATQNIPEGWRMVDKYVELSPPSLRPLNRLLGQMRMAIALARVGLADSARHVAEGARGDATVDSGRELPQLEAIARWIIGDKDEAFKQLSIWLASNPQQLEALDKDDSWEFRELRKDPRFKALARSK